MNNLNMLPGNHMDDRRYCSIENNKFGEVSGCSVTHNNIYKNSKQDFIKKISDDSFSSQIFGPEEPSKEDIKMIDGIQLQKSSLHIINLKMFQILTHLVLKMIIVIEVIKHF